MNMKSAMVHSPRLVFSKLGIGASSFVGYSCFSIPHGAALVSNAYELMCKRKPLRPKACAAAWLGSGKHQRLAIASFRLTVPRIHTESQNRNEFQSDWRTPTHAPIPAPALILPIA